MEADGDDGMGLFGSGDGEAGAGAVEEAEGGRKERWVARLAVARGALQWLAPRARPVADRAAAIAQRGGELIGSGVKMGGTAVGVGVAGVGVVAVGGVAGAGLAVAGGVIASSSIVGGWIVGKVGDGIALGTTFSGAMTEKSLQGSDRVLEAANSVLTSSSQAEIVLGREGAAVLDTVLSVGRNELGGMVGDATYREILRGLIGYICLQRRLQPVYTAQGFSRRLRDSAIVPPPLQGVQAFGQIGRAAGEEGPLPGDQGMDRLREVLRAVQISHVTYGAAHNLVVGIGKPKNILDDNNAAAIRILGLSSEKDLIHVQWQSRGPHQPSYIVVADRAHGTLVVAIRGTFSPSDALTDLRCEAYGVLRVTAHGGQGKVHIGMWDSAVRLDAELGDMIEEALDGDCKGLKLRLVGHSLGAGVASLLALRWHQRFPGLHCFAFAPPCVGAPPITSNAQAFITSIVLSNDAVCRWSLASTKDVLSAAITLNTEPGAVSRLLSLTLVGDEVAGRLHGPLPGSPFRGSPNEAAIEAENQDWCKSLMSGLEAGMDTEKLYPIGRIVWLTPPAPVSGLGEEWSFVEEGDSMEEDAPIRTGDGMEEDTQEQEATWEVPSGNAGGSEDVPGAFSAEIVDATMFERIVFTRGMLRDHLVHNYEAVLKDLLQQAETPPGARGGSRTTSPIKSPAPGGGSGPKKPKL